MKLAIAYSKLLCIYQTQKYKVQLIVCLELTNVNKCMNTVYTVINYQTKCVFKLVSQNGLPILFKAVTRTCILGIAIQLKHLTTVIKLPVQCCSKIDCTNVHRLH